jgi:murein DD-endopeptidase MepM/ murein hydrolase activator NlpD
MRKVMRVCFLFFVAMLLFELSLFADDPAMTVQLPFVDGVRYECNQNSDDAPTHGRNNSYASVSAPYTKYDLDFGLGRGSLVTAAANGTVETGSGSGFGNYIKINHNNGYFTLYGHLMDNGFIVKDGSNVVAGQPIGFSGNTGISLGSGGGYHLHFGVHQGSGVGISARMTVKAKEYGYGGSFIREGNFSTGSESQRETYCLNDRGGANRGNKYEAIPLSGIFNQWQCHHLDNDLGMLCWQGYNGNFAFCDDGQHHTRYYNSGGGFRSASVSLTSSNVAQMCYPNNTNQVNLYSYLDGQSLGVGGSGTETLSDDTADPGLPDFIMHSLILKDSSGTERYSYNNTETIVMHSYSKNIGDANWVAFPGHDEAEAIDVRFYLSNGYKEDAHSVWRRVGKEEIKKGHLDVGDTKNENASLNLATAGSGGPLAPGVYNIVACVDRNHDEDNEDGEVPEKHKSNNCSTEAVFTVEAPVQPKPDYKWLIPVINLHILN